MENIFGILLGWGIAYYLIMLTFAGLFITGFIALIVWVVKSIFKD